MFNAPFDSISSDGVASSARSANERNQSPFDGPTIEWPFGRRPAGGMKRRHQREHRAERERDGNAAKNHAVPPNQVRNAGPSVTDHRARQGERGSSFRIYLFVSLLFVCVCASGIDPAAREPAVESIS